MNRQKFHKKLIEEAFRDWDPKTKPEVPAVRYSRIEAFSFALHCDTSVEPEGRPRKYRRTRRAGAGADSEVQSANSWAHDYESFSSGFSSDSRTIIASNSGSSSSSNRSNCDSGSNTDPEPIKSGSPDPCLTLGSYSCTAGSEKIADPGLHLKIKFPLWSISQSLTDKRARDASHYGRQNRELCLS
ncbi:hypothetical protein PG984_006764 [Apiospora sp. TS-2023a]